MKVPLLDLTRRDPELEEELNATFQRVMKSGRFILGPEVDALEKECAERIGVKYALGVSSGTDALLIALMALGVGPGDEVICPTYTFFATAGSVWRTGARPVFVDSVPCCFNCDPEDIERKLSDRTRVLLPVHLFGQCADMDPILEIARSRGIAVIEDAAQAIGAEYKGRGAGSLGTVGCFSFFPSKNLGGFGDAGLVTTNDAELAEKLRILRVHGGKPKYYHQIVGGNFRIDALQAALLRVKLKRLDTLAAGRQRNAALYTQLFEATGIATTARTTCGGAVHEETAEQSSFLTLPVSCRAHHIYNQYVLRVAGEGTRDRLWSFLSDKGIGAEVYYPVPLHLQECFASVGGPKDSFPVAERAARETLALPIFPELRDDEIRHVVASIQEFAASEGAC